MTDTKREIIERMAIKFTKIESPDAKGYAAMAMTAFAAGKEAGKLEERKRWEQKQPA